MILEDLGLNVDESRWAPCKKCGSIFSNNHRIKYVPEYKSMVNLFKSIKEHLLLKCLDCGYTSKFHTADYKRRPDETDEIFK